MSQSTEPVGGVEISDQYLPSNLSLPSYIPLHRSLEHDFNRVFRNTSISNNDLTEQSIRQHKQIAFKYIDYILSQELLEFNEDTLFNFLNTYTNLVLSNRKISKIDELKNDDVLKMYISPEKELNLSTISQYHESIIPDVEDYINAKKREILYSKVRTIKFFENDEFYKLLRGLTFVMKKPEDPIPDEEDEEDDSLGVSGGKVSLKDPITLNIFKDPVISICHHTFEKQSIQRQLMENRNQSFICPISGCDQPLNSNSFTVDKLMKARVKAFSRMEKNSNDQLDIVT
ncbi:hypothetical protein KGF54_003486 [Candida jiufengensis]|uniref:uncharacterized protein n=1 Tax=Candida jiufengensis TaxID=497108 RepID=UPI002225411A|nr:uncharacterized protein KGF54_003486 [Candida jiufengensis]KAI5952619.1 hypothetical protein KGF54_003486 [Candida jiufengensis]